MNLAYEFQNPVNYFNVIGDVTPQDLRVIRAALFRFFESAPGYVVLNFAAARGLDQIPNTELNQVLSEIQSFASASKVSFQIVRAPDELGAMSRSILEKALEDKLALLESKNGVKADLKETASRLKEENERLKKELQDIPLAQDTGSLTSLLERFWSSNK